MHVEIRIKGKNKKYYLAHSLRINKRVKKLRFYLGSNLSKFGLDKKRKKAEAVMEERIRNYRILPDPFYVAIKPLELQEIKSMEAGSRIKTLHLTDRDWEKFTKLFTYDTNAIEGSTVNLKEVSEIFRNKWPKERTRWEISETLGVAEAVKLIRNTRDHISLNLIRELHRTVFKNSKEFAGKFRGKGIEVAVMDSFGNIVHRGAPSKDVVRLLKELTTWYKRNKNKYPPILLAAVLHNHFETIHPFQDGNGRVGRLLLNNILIKHGMPPVNIELKNRFVYYKTLQAYQKEKNIRPMIELILKEYKSLRKTLKG